jgi:Fe(3+) dicitrate transport protein
MRRVLRCVAVLAATGNLCAGTALAQDNPAPPSQAEKDKAERVVVTGERRREDTPAKLEHIMREVAGTKITVTKKTTVTKLEELPPIVNNNLQEALAQSPGIFVSQQQTPTQFNLSYRGLGNPQESEYVLVMQDGIPINTDWIGFPTLYYMPLLDGISEIQEIRGGSSLLYGPEPAPVINLVSIRPPAGGPFAASTQQIGGDFGLYSTYNVIQGSEDDFDFRATYGHVQADGQRQNADSRVDQGDIYVAWHASPQSLWSLELMGNEAGSGDPGRISFAQFETDPSFSPTPYNHDWVSRYSAVLSNASQFGDGWELEGKAWAAYQDLASRSAAALAAGVPPPTTTIQDELFRNEGADIRVRKSLGGGNAVTFGTELYHDDAPFRQWTGIDLSAAHGDHDGVPRLRQERSSDYKSVFAEAVFRLPYRIHVVPSVRLEDENVTVHETVKPPFLSRPLIDVDANKFIPLFGFGIGNDFGHDNETYFNVSQGWRPLRFFDVGSPFSNIQPGNIANPQKSLSFEAGVHGTPITGLFYDVSLYWIDFTNRIETIVIDPTDSIEQNSGNTRNRGFEGQVSYDFLAGDDGPEHLSVFGNVSYLDATFTASAIPGQVGKTPAFAPKWLGKFGLIWREQGRYSVSLSGVAITSQYFQDSDLPSPGGLVPAKVPSYATVDVAADYNLTPKLRLIGGVSNLFDEKYYSRVFQNGIEPAPGRAFYAGLALAL